MPSLLVETPDGHKLNVDVTGQDPSQYDAVATAAVKNYMAQFGTAPSNEEGVEATPLSPLRVLGNVVQAGGAAIGDALTGKSPSTISSDASNAMEEQPLSGTPAKIGSGAASLITPESLLAMGGMDEIMAGLSPEVTQIISGWSKTAAANAIGKISQLAKYAGLDKLDALADFVLKPINLAGKIFAPIIDAISSPQDMLNRAEQIRQAAFYLLKKSAGLMDDAIAEMVGNSGKSTAMETTKPIIDLSDLVSKIEDLEEQAVGEIKRLAPDVASQYEDAIQTMKDFIKDETSGDSKTVFSDLASLKSKIDQLVYRNGQALRSKAALEDVGNAIRETLSDATQTVGGPVADDYELANEVYNKVMAVISGLEGRAVDAKNWFSIPSALTALGTAAATHGLPALVEVPAAYAATKAATIFGPSAVASGLDAFAPYSGPLVSGLGKLAAASASGINDALNGNGQ